MISSLNEKKSGLTTDLKEIVQEGEFRTNIVKLEATIHIIDIKKDLKIPKLISMNLDRNYSSDYGDRLSIATYMPLGNFIKTINPYKENLEITLSISYGKQKSTDRYKVIIMNDDINVNNPLFEEGTMEDLNSEMAYIEFNLVDRVLDVLMMKTTFGTFNDMSVDKPMITLMDSFLKGVEIENDNKDRLLSLIPIDNTKTYSNILLQNPLPVLDIPAYIQGKEYGLYYGGVGTYLQCYGKKRILWIFPLYDSSDKNRKDTRLKLFVTKEAKYKEVETTYLIDNSKSIRIVVTTEDELTESRFNIKRDYGNSDSYIEVDSITSRSQKVSKDKITVKESDVKDYKLQNENVDGSVKHRHHGIRGNKFNIETMGLKNAGRIIKVLWKFSVPDLLIPGMLVEYYYEKKIEGKLKVQKGRGTLLGSYTTIDNNKRMSQTMLFVFLN